MSKLSTIRPKIVVLGGSFNPPTLAHKFLMESVIQIVNADRGIYVPSSDYYVSRKVSKNRASYMFLSSERINMLESMCVEGLTEIDTCEIGDSSTGRTHETLQEIKNKNPDHDIYFIIGSDKLQILSKWKLSNLLNDFKIIVIERNGDDAKKIIANIPKLMRYKNSFVILDEITGYSKVSSSNVQALYRNKKYNQAKQYVTSEVHEIILNHLSVIKRTSEISYRAAIKML